MTIRLESIMAALGRDGDILRYERRLYQGVKAEEGLDSEASKLVASKGRQSQCKLVSSTIPKLTSDAKRTLNKLGEALQETTLSQYRFRIEGHTDATGTEGYNQRLSERRAKNVKQYIMDTLGIDVNRLQTEGGEVLSY